MSDKEETFGFNDIDEDQIAIPIECIHEGRTFYGVHVLFRREGVSKTQKKITFHSYSSFERLAKNINHPEAPPLPPKYEKANRKENLEKYIKKLYHFLRDKKPVYRNPFTMFVYGIAGKDAKVIGKELIISADVALKYIKDQREIDQSEIIKMVQFVSDIPTPMSWRKPLLCFFGFESSGKSTVINYLWGLNFRKDTKTDTGYTIIESVSEEEFKKCCTNYSYIELDKETIINGAEGFDRNCKVYLELDSVATLNRYKAELGDEKSIFKTKGLSAVLINEKYFKEVVDEERFEFLKSITVLDSDGINSINIKDKGRQDAIKFFLRDCALSAVLCGEQNLNASDDMYKLFCECARDAYMAKEEIKKSLCEKIKIPNTNWGFALSVLGYATRFIPKYGGLLTSVLDKCKGSESDATAATESKPEESKLAQHASFLDNIFFCVTKLDKYESFESKVYELALHLGRCFENPPTFDRCFFVSREKETKGGENLERFLDTVKRIILSINSNRVKDGSIKVMTEMLEPVGFMNVDKEKLGIIKRNVDERLKLWELGYQI